MQFVHLPDLDMVTGTNVTNAFPRHIHESLCIGLVERGARMITSQDEAICISPGEAFVLNPGQPHNCQLTGSSYHVISIKPDIVQSLVGIQKNSSIHLGVIRLKDRQITHHLRKLCSLIEGPHEPLKRETVLMNFLTRLIGCYGSHPPDICRPGAQDRMIRRAQDYIHEHYARKLKLVELAAVCCLSPYHFQHVFVEQTGLSPQDYVLHTRIKRGKSLLRQGVPIAEVAQDVGFVDQSHFTHSFKRIVGFTPGCFARQYH